MTKQFQDLAAEIIVHAHQEYKKKYSHEYKMQVISEMTEQLIALKECYEKLLNTKVSMYQFSNDMKFHEIYETDTVYQD
jgi:hypothetical protein